MTVHVMGKFPGNSQLAVAEFWRSQKSKAGFLPHGGLAPLASAVFKGQPHEATSGTVGKMGQVCKDRRKRETERQKSRR